ncbi:hypothetical protein HPB51_007009 [Rhipicephalus microplus]|uniref:Uncharacterized protein n=1 Tax=Rhipicephalus microplus TaxID=6941 RepID=A0A9J6E052_RHIMP|nr:hypothetical protein HPB51_007009 [Rhipicephalus microplus]
MVRASEYMARPMPGVATPALPDEMNTGACNFTGLNLERMVVDVLKHLPVTYAEHENWPEAFVAGLLSSSIIYTGFDKLKLAGPVVPYCTNGTRLVHAELATTGEDQIVASASWKTCNGLNGTFGTYTGARVAVTFEVVKPGYPYHAVNGAVLTHHRGPKPVFIDKRLVYSALVTPTCSLCKTKTMALNAII